MSYKEAALHIGKLSFGSSRFFVQPLCISPVTYDRKLTEFGLRQHPSGHRRGLHEGQPEGAVRFVQAVLTGDVQRMP